MILFAIVFPAARVMNSMDRTADPCNDFYKFACGGWLKENPIPDDQSSISTFAKTDKALKKELKGKNFR